MTNKSKGVQLRNYMRTLELIRLHKKGLSWGQIGRIMKMDPSNARKAVIRWKRQSDQA
jgi:hypothetical protein